MAAILFRSQCIDKYKPELPDDWSDGLGAEMNVGRKGLISTCKHKTVALKTFDKRHVINL